MHLRTNQFFVAFRVMMYLTQLEINDYGRASREGIFEKNLAIYFTGEEIETRINFCFRSHATPYCWDVAQGERDGMKMGF